MFVINGVAMEEKCTRCNEKGADPDDGYRCKACQGTKVRPTEKGKELIEFLGRNAHIKCQGGQGLTDHYLAVKT